MTMSSLFCVILTIIAAFNGKGVVSEDVAFENVTVTASGYVDGILQFMDVIEPNNLREYGCINKIWTIKGPLRILRKNSVTDLPKLWWFGIDGNKNLEHIEVGAFKNLPSLRVVCINNTSLKEIDEGVFNNLLLENIVLNDNQITRIAPRAFDNMTNLEFINLSGNKFTQWDPNWFQNTPRLKELHFNNHQIQELPENAFGNFRNNEEITSVTFVNGPLKALGNNLFGGLKKVRIMEFSRNKIENFGEDVLNGLETLQALDLSYNEIQCFAGNLSRIFLAKTTYLQMNPLINNEGCTKAIDIWRESHSHRVAY